LQFRAELDRKLKLLLPALEFQGEGWEEALSASGILSGYALGS
jgi:hypothetical protein